jgi:hypothetical protein
MTEDWSDLLAARARFIVVGAAEPSRT